MYIPPWAALRPSKPRRKPAKRTTQFPKGEDITFTLSGYERRMAQHWELRHKCKWGKEGPTSTGEKFAYIFSSCGIGVSKIVKCWTCGKTKDVTDYDTW